MKYGYVDKLGFVPAVWPPNSHSAGYCLDTWRTGRFPLTNPAFVGRWMSIPNEVQALQLRPDGFRGANEVRLVFQPHDIHDKAFGPGSIVLRAGEVVRVPWKEQVGNARVEVYPVGQAEANPNEWDSHYAIFALLEYCDLSDAYSWQPHATSLFQQAAGHSLSAATPVSGAADRLPGLYHVPCKGMRSAALRCPKPTGSVAFSEADGYFVSVWSNYPERFPIMPIAYIPSDNGVARRSVYFQIPAACETLEVRAWLHTNAVQLDGLDVELTSAPPTEMEPSIRCGGHRNNVGFAAVPTAATVLASIIRPHSAAARNTIFVAARNEDASADACNINLVTFVNVGAGLSDANNTWDYHTRYSANLGPVAANANLFSIIDDRVWDAAILTADCVNGVPTCDNVWAALYTAIGV